MNKKALLLIFSLLTPPATAGEVMTPGEKTWIKNHPEVSYTVTGHWPQESVKNGVHRGLSREVLNQVEKRTGLKFRYVSPEQALLDPPMMISAVNGALLSDRDRHYWLLTFSWANTMPMIVGLKGAVRLRTLKQLTGQRVAIVENSDYISWLQNHYPNIHLVIEPDILSALKSVSEGKNAAAIASGLVMLPILQRNYTHQLAIVAQVAEMASGINMAIAPEYPELRTIIDKTMENITAQDAEKMFVRWIGIVDIGTPTLAMVVWLYRYPLIVIFLLIILLLFAWHNTLKARRRAEKSEKHKADFLAVMSHEIRTPMNAIVASLELLKTGGHNNKNSEFIDLAHNASQDLLALLNSVLDHEKISQSEVTVHMAPVQLNTLLQAILETHRASAHSKGLELHHICQAPVGTGWILTDAHRLRQIVNNLLSNAIKFTQQGTVSLSAGYVGDRLLIRVDDTGPGISTEAQAKLFNAWTQAGDLNVGSGLGLYISRSLALSLQGTLTLQSEPGEGTRLLLDLPLIWCAPEAIVEEKDPLPDYQHNCSVLLVEDHEASRKLMAQQLSLLGCHYDLAQDGENALMLLEQENYYDVILLDCGLPGMDGYTVASRIRALEELRSVDATPVIAISAQHSVEHIARCRESGMNDVLSKPVRLDDIVNAFKKWCPVTADYVDTITGCPESEPDEEVWLSIHQDIEAFGEAARTPDVTLMIYHIHRIRGVAMMFSLDELAELAEDIEERLRKKGYTGTEEETWLQDLQKLTDRLSR